MKIYKDNGNGRLEGVCGLPRVTTSDVFVSEGFQIYILIEDPRRGAWLTDNECRVSLWNVHLTGELRWNEPSNGSFRDPFTHLSPDALLAARHFSLCPSILTQDEWLRILESYTIKLGDLSDLEIEMLRDAYRDEFGEGKINCDDEDGSDRSSSMYRMKQKGLINLLGSVSFIGKTTEFFGITKKGREILEKGAA